VKDMKSSLKQSVGSRQSAAPRTVEVYEASGSADAGRTGDVSTSVL